MSRAARKRETSVDYANPHRPLLLRGVNRIGAGFARAGRTVDLSLKGLLSAARSKERRENFGDENFLHPLQVLLDATETEANLHFFGRFAARQRMVNVLRNRLRLNALLQRHPEIRETTLPPIILITGLQRTGTTKLHRLLASDPSNGSLSSWAAVNPVPFEENRERDLHRRKQVAVRSQKALAYLAPDFFAIHPVEAHSPEEDVLLLDYAFLSTVPESIMNVPTYAAFVETSDNRPAYACMKTLLQVQQWLDPKDRWVLKSPHHLEFLPEFLEFFPGTTVVHTHRDPASTLPSFCSMISHGHGVFTDRVDPLGVGRHWLRKTARMISMGLAARDRLTSGRVLDVWYSELLGDPIGQVERIYRAVGTPLSPGARVAMETSLAVNVQHKYGVHRYHIDSFGFTKEMIRAAYGDYVGRFSL